MAPSGHGSMSDQSPLSGEERKSNFGAAKSVGTLNGHCVAAQTKAASPKNRRCYRLSRHAIRYKGDLRTSSAAVLDTPMSASSRSSSWRSSLYWYCRSNPNAIPASHASAIFQDHLRFGNEVEAASRLLVELQIVLPQVMFHLRNGAKQRLAAGAHRAVVNGPSAFCTTTTLAAQWSI
jgi:hypothetical protein